jgi:hypothetical protein
MKVGNKFTVKWEYDTDYVVRQVNGKSVQVERDITRCTIVNDSAGENENKIISSETIARMWSDPYCKDTARKLSMQKALAFSSEVLDKQTRALFWEVYRTQTKVPKWSKKIVE